jgi:hypothetical protein
MSHVAIKVVNTIYICVFPHEGQYIARKIKIRVDREKWKGPKKERAQAKNIVERRD